MKVGCAVANCRWLSSWQTEWSEFHQSCRLPALQPAFEFERSLATSAPTAIAKPSSHAIFLGHHFWAENCTTHAMMIEYLDLHDPWKTLRSIESPNFGCSANTFAQRLQSVWVNIRPNQGLLLTPGIYTNSFQCNLYAANQIGQPIF